MRGKGRPEKENNNGCNRPSHCAPESDGWCRDHRLGNKRAARHGRGDAACDAERSWKGRWRFQAGSASRGQAAAAGTTSPSTTCQSTTSPSLASPSTPPLGLLVASRPSSVRLAMEITEPE